jgi:F-type H+-transporting ATPase subunit epsilon
MAEDAFTVKLVTPERVLISGSATEVILRTGDGDITFLAGHTPLVGTVEPGVIRVLRPDGLVRVAAHGGFVQVEQHVSSSEEEEGTRVTLLIGVAELAEEIDADRARVALEVSEARVAELRSVASSGGSAGSGDGDQIDPELAEAEAALRRAEVRLEAIDATAGAPAAHA